MKRTLAAATCGGALVWSLAACGGGDKTSNLSAPASPRTTNTTTPSTSATSRPAATLPTATATRPGSATLAAHSTYRYGGLKVLVNLPADIPSTSRPDMRHLSAFLQADGRTIARNKLDPDIARLASPEVVKYVRSTPDGQSVQAVGLLSFTIDTIRTAGRSALTLITGCSDQSKVVQVRKDGSHYVDTSVKKFPTLKMTAVVNRLTGHPVVTQFTFAAGTCR